MVEQKVKRELLSKVFISVLGGTNAMFGIFIPITLALLLTPFVEGFTESTLLIIAFLSSMYRAIDIGMVK